MHLSFFNLLLLISLLFFCLFKFALCFILFILLLSFFTFFLDSLAFSFTFILLSSVFLVTIFAFHKLLLSFIKPSDITDKSLFKFIFNHLSIVFLFSSLLSIFGCFDLLPDFILLISNLLKLLLIWHFSILDLFLFTFNLIDTFLDAINHFLDLRQRLWFFFLTLTQIVYFFLDLLLLFN
jgi:hypothetical protein